MKRLFVLPCAIWLLTGIVTATSVCASVKNPGPASDDNSGNRYVPPKISRVVHIPGGLYTTPYIISTPNTEYVLDGDISAEGTAIAVRAKHVIVNLNGKTVTYNQTVPGTGLIIDTWNITDVVITNGSIIQGAAMSEGDEYGRGNNPIRSSGVTRLRVADIHAKYGGRDVGGICVAGSEQSIYENNTIEDVWAKGTFKNRHQGVDAISGNRTSSGDTYNIFRNNIIINARQRGINTSRHDKVYGNKITINSLATNSFGILANQYTVIYNNLIDVKGEHPIGVFSNSNATIYNNEIYAQTTKLGDEYGSNPKCFNSTTPCGNYAVGYRTTWGGNTISFHDNSITVRTDSRYQGTYSPTGKPVVVNGKGRGLMVAINTGEKSRFYNNKITVLDKDGTGKAYGIACTGGNLGEMIFDANTVTSNILNVALGDEYGACGGFPLFYRNTFVKADNYPAYKTIASELGGYFEGTGRFVSNIFQGGASDKNINNNLAGRGRKSVYFGREVTATLQDTVATIPIVGAAVTLQNGGAPFDATATTDALGMAKLIVYEYELHNADSTSNKILTRTLAPHTIHAVIGSDTYTTLPDKSPAAWDIMNDVAGTFTLPLWRDGVIDAGKKLTLTH